MSSMSIEKRRYHVRSADVDGTRFVQVSVVNDQEQLVTRDHFTVDEGRTFAAEFILATET